MAVWALIGFMGCGKSSIGRLVARMAACPESLLPPESFPSSPENGSAGKAPDGNGTFAAGRNSGDNLPAQAFSEATGRYLGDNLPAQLVFVDLDAEIEARNGRSIREIFAEGGEAGFRAIERETLAQLLSAVGTCPFGSSLRSPHHRLKPTVPPLPCRGWHVPQGQVPLPNRAQLKNDPLPSDMLISLGGGTLTDEGSRELVKKNCKCIYLRATVETLAANLREAGTEGRPMLAGANLAAPADAPDSLESHIATMMAARGPIYEKAADIILDIDGLSYEQAARQILSIKSSGS